MISAIVTRGFGAWGSIALVVTRGYAIGADEGSEWTPQAPVSGSWTAQSAGSGSWTPQSEL